MPKVEEREDEQTTAQELFAGLQGEGIAGGGQGRYTLAELSKKFDVHPNQITQWKAQLLERMADVFDRQGGLEATPIDVMALHAKIGELTLENDYLEGALTKVGWLSAKK